MNSLCFAVYNSASPRARRGGMGLSQGARQTLPSLLLLHSQITATHEQNKSEEARSAARTSYVQHVQIHFDCSTRSMSRHCP